MNKLTLIRTNMPNLVIKPTELPDTVHGMLELFHAEYDVLLDPAPAGNCQCTAQTHGVLESHYTIADRSGNPIALLVTEE